VTARVIVATISFCVMLTCLFLANTLVTMMIGEINRKKPVEPPISYVGFGPSKIQRVLKEYRSSYPSGRLNVYASAAFIMAMLALLGVAFSLNIIG